MNLAALVQEAFKVFGPDDARAILADAALHYNSTAAHNARAQDLAAEILIEALTGHSLNTEGDEAEAIAEAAADAGESIEEYLCGTRRGHAFNTPETERDRCYCLYCGKDGDA
jgi:hypothetical protein